MSTTPSDTVIRDVVVVAPTYGRAELISGAIVFAAGLFWYIASFDIRETAHLVQASFFPRIIAVGLMGTGGFLAVRGLIGWRREKDAPAELETGDAAVLAEPVEPSAPLEGEPGMLDAEPEDRPMSTTRRLLIIIGMLAVYAITIIPVGYIITTFLFLVAMTMFIDRAHWLRNLIFAAVFTATVYVLFNEVLKVILPGGILEGLL